MFYFQKCDTKEVNVLKQIPQTSCRQIKKEICFDSLCPLVEKEVCQDIEQRVIFGTGQVFSKEIENESSNSHKTI